MTAATRKSARKTPRTLHQTIDRYMTPSPHTIGSDQTLSTAHKLMREHQIRHLPVLDGGKLVGLVSDRDLKLVESLKGTNPDEVLVEEAMTIEPYSVPPLASLEMTVREMARHKIGSAVVMDQGRVVGIFTALDGLSTLAWLLERNGD